MMKSLILGGLMGMFKAADIPYIILFGVTIGIFIWVIVRFVLYLSVLFS